MAYKTWHHWTGILVAGFVGLHLMNHLAAWFGIEKHQAVMETLRMVYRQPLVEGVLVVCFLFQVGSGLRMAWQLRKKPNRSRYEAVQLYSGLAFAFFILQHLSTVLGQRWYWQLDTNFYFAARVVLEQPYALYFIPYYFLGVTAFGVHIANIHQKKIAPYVGETRAKYHFWVLVGGFVWIAMLILYIFTGNRFPIQIPSQYLM